MPASPDFMARADRALIRYGADWFDAEILRAEGARVFAADGRSILDFTSGQMSAVLGHSHPEITETIRDMAGRMAHLYSGMLSAPVVDLAETLCATKSKSRCVACSPARAAAVAEWLCTPNAKRPTNPGATIISQPRRISARIPRAFLVAVVVTASTSSGLCVECATTLDSGYGAIPASLHPRLWAFCTFGGQPGLQRSHVVEL